MEINMINRYTQYVLSNLCSEFNTGNKLKYELDKMELGIY